MSNAITKLQEALKLGMENRPKVGGFPYLAECLRQAGAIKNIWTLPSCQSIFITNEGPVVIQGTPLFTGMVDLPKFNREALVKAIRADQEGLTTFPQFLEASWKSGCVTYEVDFHKRKVTYFGCLGEYYLEEYPEVEIKK